MEMPHISKAVILILMAILQNYSQFVHLYYVSMQFACCKYKQECLKHEDSLPAAFHFKTPTETSMVAISQCCSHRLFLQGLKEGRSFLYVYFISLLQQCLSLTPRVYQFHPEVVQLLKLNYKFPLDSSYLSDHKQDQLLL